LIPGIFDGEHSFSIEAASADRVRFTRTENFTGIIVAPLAAMLRDTEHGFAPVNEALKSRAQPMFSGRRTHFRAE
jgi:hypothetical protein